MIPKLSERDPQSAERSTNPSYLAECRALRLLYQKKFDEMSPDERRAKHHSLMWTLEALRGAGFKIEYPEDAASDPVSDEKKEKKSDTSDHALYVCPLNKGFEGPLSLDEAVKTALSIVYVPDEKIDETRKSVEAGDPGPWHFVYGFTSVTIQRENPQ
jgi:hypothetical protein